MKVLFDAEHVSWAHDRAYVVRLRDAIEAARSRIFVRQFVIDARPSEDFYGEVRYVLHALAEARHRGVDVQVLLARVEETTDFFFDVNEPAALFLQARRVPVRRLVATGAPGGGSHAKVALFDEEHALLGNHNWTPSAFRVSSEASLEVRSRELVHVLANGFTQMWKKARPYEQP